MKKHLKFTVLILITMTVLACKYSKTYINRAKDQNDAKEVITNFYKNLNNKNFEGIYAQFINANNLTETKARNQKLKRIFDLTIQELGNIKSIKLISCSTKVIESDNNIGEYYLSYFVVRDKMEVFENFKLVIDNNVIKITDFKVDLEKR